MEHMEPSIDNPAFKIMLDLSVPRNIDPEIAKLDFVDLANMDMLSDVTDEAYKKREEEIPHVKQIIEDEFSKYKLLLNELYIDTTFKTLHLTFYRHCDL